MNLEQLIETTQLANTLINEHGLAATDPPWTFKFNNRRKAIGLCDPGTHTIEVSKWYIDSHPDQIRDTILHEIAHALVHERYPKEDHGHDHVWRMVCIEIGANPTRTVDMANSNGHAQFNGNYNYTVSCQNDNCPQPWTAGRFRIKDAFWDYHCKYCKGPLTVIDLRTHEVYETTPRTQRTTT